MYVVRNFKNKKQGLCLKVSYPGAPQDMSSTATKVVRQTVTRQSLCTPAEDDTLCNCGRCAWQLQGKQHTPPSRLHVHWPGRLPDPLAS